MTFFPATVHYFRGRARWYAMNRTYPMNDATLETKPALLPGDRASRRLSATGGAARHHSTTDGLLPCGKTVERWASQHLAIG